MILTKDDNDTQNNPMHNNDKPEHQTFCIQSTIFMQENNNLRPHPVPAIETTPSNTLLCRCPFRQQPYHFYFDKVLTLPVPPAHSFLTPLPSQSRTPLGYMLFCTGFVSGERRKGLSSVGMVFYERLKEAMETWTEVRINVIGVGEEAVFDLLGKTSAKVREFQHIGKQGSEVYFSGAKQIIPKTLYEAYKLVKDTLQIKNKFLLNSSYLIHGKLLPSSPSNSPTNFLLLDSTSPLLSFRPWQFSNSATHNVNRCLFEVSPSSSHNTPYLPFRDSNITKIIKPFLTWNTTVDVVGFVNDKQDELNLITLKLVENIVKIKKKYEIIRRKTKTNNKTINKTINKTDLSQSHLHPRHPYKIPRFKTISTSLTHSRILPVSPTIPNPQSLQQQPSLTTQIRNNIKKQIQITKKLQETRHIIKLIKVNQEIQAMTEPMIQSALVETEELKLRQQQELQFLKEEEELSKVRQSIIGKSTSQAQKLKLLQSYLTGQLTLQNHQIASFLTAQKGLTKIYRDKLRSLDPSPPCHPTKTPRHNPKSRHSSFHKPIVKSLLLVDDKPKKRNVFIRNPISNGRIDFEHFLEKHVQRYQMYPMPR